MPRITYVSDIHLEFFDKTPSYHKLMGWEKGDILCLAGDIGYPEQETYHTFMAYCSSLFEHVFVIAGNHEYYTYDKKKTIESTNKQIEHICSSFPNVHFLNNTTYYLQKYDIYFLGTTLWTTTTGETDEMLGYNDFQKIPQFRLMGYMDLLHTQSVGYLINELETRTASKVIVMTHHMPSFDLIAPEYKGGSLNHLFASNLNYLFKKYTIDHWICGHSHVAMETQIGRTHIHMNPIGYPGENTPKWDASFEA